MNRLFVSLVIVVSVCTGCSLETISLAKVQSAQKARGGSDVDAWLRNNDGVVRRANAPKSQVLSAGLTLPEPADRFIEARAESGWNRNDGNRDARVNIFYRRQDATCYVISARAWEDRLGGRGVDGELVLALDRCP